MKGIILFCIKQYKKHYSPFFESIGVHCKYYPTCSEYAIEALNKYGTIKGLWMIIKRVVKCNPFSKGGYDPVK